MSENKTQLQTNNEKLAALITELEGKAAGGGGSVETCTVQIICNTNDINAYSYLSYANGEFVPVFVNYYYSDGSTSIDITLPDVVCGGIIYIQTRINTNFMAISVDGEATAEATTTYSSAYGVALIYAPNTANSSSTVTIVDND